jgi:hypothetical protein
MVENQTFFRGFFSFDARLLAICILNQGSCNTNNEVKVRKISISFSETGL